MFLVSKKSFTLTELLIAIVLMGLIILAVTSVDITSRRFFGAASRESRIQDEAKIAMEHIAKYVQLGVGDINNPGFTITPGGSGIQVRLDKSLDGMFTSTTDGDVLIDYTFQGSPDYKIVFTEMTQSGTTSEDLAVGIATTGAFSVGRVDNQVNVSITIRRKPGENPGPENPETTLTSSIVLRAMSVR